MNNAAGLASLFDLGTGTGDPRLDAALGMAPISEADLLAEEQAREAAVSGYGGYGGQYDPRLLSKDKMQRASALAPVYVQAGRELGVDPSLLMAVHGAESSFVPGQVSSKGAMGLGQFIPSTWKKYGEGNPNDPYDAARATAKYMRDLLDMFGGDERLAVAAYNAGEGAVKKYGGIPPYKETQKYTRDVLGTRDQYNSMLGGEMPPAQQQPQGIPKGIKPQLLSTGETVGVPEHLELADIAKLLESKGEKGVPVKPFTAPNGETVAVPYNLNDDQIHSLLRQKAPDLLVKPGMPTPDKSGYTAAAKQSLINTLGQLGVGAGTALEKMGATELGPALKEKGLAAEEAAKGMYEKPPEGQDSWFKEHIGIPVTQGAAGLVPLAPAMMVPGMAGIAATAGAVGLQEAGALEQRAREEGKPIEDWTGAAPTILGATALNFLPVKAISPLFKAASSDLILGSKEAIQKLIADEGIEGAKKAVGSRVQNILKQAGVVEAEGLGADIGTSVLERSYLDKPLWDDEAKQEYIDIAKQGAAFYPVAGGGAGFVQHHAAATELQRAVEQEATTELVKEQKAREAARSEEIAAKEKPAPEIPEDIAALNLPKAEEEALIKMKAEQEASVTGAPVQEEGPYYDLLGLKNKKRNVAYKALQELNPDDPLHAETIGKVLDEIERKNMPRNQAAIDQLRQRLAGEPYAYSKQEAAKPDVSGGAQPEVRQEGEGAPISGEGVREGRPEVGAAEEGKVEEVKKPTPILDSIKEPPPVRVADYATPEEALKASGLAGETKQKSFGEKFGETARDLVKEGRHTTLHTEYFDAQSGVGKALKDLPTLIDKKARGDFAYSAHAQRGNAIQNSYHDGYLTLGPDDTLHGVRDPHLSVKNIFQKVNDYKGDPEPTKLFSNMIVALRGRTIRQQDKAIRKQANDLLVRADLLEDHAKTQTDPNKIAKYIRSADNLRNIAEQRLSRINYDTGRTMVTDEQVRQAEEIQRTHPELAKQADNLYSLMQKQPELWYRSGLIDKDTMKEWQDYANYVPFYKAEDFEQMMIDPSKYIEDIASKMGRGSKSLPVVHEQRRHQHEIYLEDNVLRHIAFMASAASENAARKNTLKQMEMVGKAQPNPTGKKGDNVVMFKDNGKKQFYKVDDPNAYYALQAAQPIMNPLVRRMKKVAGFARGMMIMNPLFWFRQFVREPVQASLVGRVGMITPFDTMGAFAKILADRSEGYKDLKGRGIVGAVDVVSDPAEFVKKIQKGKGAVTQGIDAVKHIHEVVDAATRVVAYERAVEQGLKQGMDAETAKDYGAIVARELINFSKQGRSQTIRAIRATTPFFGAALNSLEVLAKAMAPENIGNLSKAEAMEARRIFYSNAAMVAMFTTAYAMAMSDDEDYLKTPDRAANWLVPTGEKKTPFAKLSIPFEAGFGIKVVPELMALHSMGAITTKEALQEAGKAAWDLVVPPMPTIYAIEPIVEAMINHDFHTGQAIESGMDETAPVEYRDKKASELMKLIGKKIEDAGINFPHLSPDKLEHIANGYMGQVWGITRVVSDALLRPEGTGVEKTLADYPITGGIVVKDTKDRAVNQFYETSKEVENVYRALTSSGTRGDAERFEEIGKNPKYSKMLSAYPAVQSIKKDMGEKMAIIERVKNDKSLTPEERTKRVDALTEERNALANRGMEALRRLKVVE